jgi:hypothetical protein
MSTATTSDARRDGSGALALPEPAGCGARLFSMRLECKSWWVSWQPPTCFGPRFQQP